MDLKQRIALTRQQAQQPDNTNLSSNVDNAGMADPHAFILSTELIDVQQQGRRSFDNLDALAKDIRLNGQLQPVIVKPLASRRYQLIAGERRLRAIRDQLQQSTILVRVREAQENEHDVRFVQIAENAQREDYLPLELAAELADLKTQTGMTVKQMAKRIGKSKGFVSKFIGLASAPAPVKEAIASGQLTATAWFNNKTLVSEQLAMPDGEAVSGTKANTPPKTKVRTATLPITLDAARDLASILQKLAAQHGLASIDVALDKKTSKKQLQAILVTRAREIAEAL